MSPPPRFTRSPWLFQRDTGGAAGYVVYNADSIIARGLTLRDARLVAVAPEMYTLLKRSHGLLRVAASVYPDFEPADLLADAITPVLLRATEPRK